jgi:ATP-dependent DNA helicase RecQ
MQKYLDILKQYWGYSSFRPLQDEIIGSVASGNDTLGLMPTGGGKSLTFQVPAMAMDGVCVVVTPLIALMKDQVENLKKRGIAAAAIFSGMSYDEILMTLENASLGAYKFLYVSPERLATRIFIEKIKQTKVCLIAVDESHCISQWGYDFRPSYLKIAEIRAFLPNAPVLALTATATPEVAEDIQKQLHFPASNIFKKSFYRSNLAYVVRYTEDKNQYLLKILNSVPGTSVVYVRNRKKTKETAEFLVKNGIVAEHYHAGLNNVKKDEIQTRWKNGKTRVIVSTNAFGMGIDKADVRSVIHLDLPDSLEAYFQEAGRAGRDEKKAFAVLLFNNSDAAKIKKRISDTFPPKEMIRKVYESLGNYYQVGIGSGLDNTFPFDLVDFCTKFHLPVLMAFSSLKILQQAGYIEFTDEEESTSQVLFTVKKEELYQLKQTPKQEKLIHVLLRSYTGLFTEPAFIHEEVVAQRLQWSHQEVYQQLVELSKEKVIRYIPRKKTAFLTFTQERVDAKQIYLSREAYEDRRERFVFRVQSVLNYAQEENVCRSQMLLSYFGEKNSQPCGKCDVCQKKKETEISTAEFEAIRSSIVQVLSNENLPLDMAVQKIHFKEKKVLQVIRFMLDNNQIKENEKKQLILAK